MAERIRPGTDFDQDLKQAAEKYVRYVGSQSNDPMLRESLLKSPICTLTRAFEGEFDGYQKVLIATLRSQADLIEEANS